MKISMKRLQELCEGLNNSGLLKEKIIIEGIDKETLITAFLDAVELIPNEKDKEISEDVITVYNYLIEIEERYVESEKKKKEENIVKEEKITYMKLSDIKVKLPFKDLFPIDSVTLKAVSKDMAVNGYDDAFPLSLWKDICVDGHTRMIAAKENNIEEIPVVIKEFDGEKEAFEYAVHNQRDRRNMSEGDILRCVAFLDKRRDTGGDRKSKEYQKTMKKKSISSGKVDSRGEVADILGVSKGKVSKARAVIKKASKKTKDKIIEGKTTINKAYESVKKKGAKVSRVDKIIAVIETKLRECFEIIKKNEKELRESNREEIRSWIRDIEGIIG